MDELELLVAKYEVREVFDDIGTFPVGKWLREYCRLMIERRLNEKIYFDCNMRFGACKPIVQDGAEQRLAAIFPRANGSIGICQSPY